MEKQKKTTSKRRGGFWRSYSFVLTLVVLASLSVVAASADTYRLMNGALQRYSLGEWRNYSMGSSGTTYSKAQYDADFQAIAQDIGIMSTVAGGGLTVDELNSSLSSYIGRRISSYNFMGLEGIFDLTIDDLYDAIAKNQIYSVIPLFTSNHGVSYLAANGSVSSWASNTSASVADLLNFGFLGLSRNLVGVSGTTRGITLFRSYSSSFNQSYDNILTLFGEFASGNHSLLNSIRYDTFQTDYRNSTYFPRFVSALIGSGSAAATYWDSSTKTESVVDYNNLLSAITAIGSSTQNDLAKLRYVLASDQDIEITEKQAPVKDAVADKFAGDSPAAVKDADVGDMAGFSGDLQDALNTGANASDVIDFISGSAGFGFFSQAVADELEGNVVNAVAEDDENYIDFYDPAVLDSYLSGGVVPW